MRRMAALGSLAAIWVALVAAPALVAQGGQPRTAGIEKVKDTLYVITGGGGNTAAFLTASGVVLVDTKLPDWGPPILEQLRTVTDKPVTHIINTHTHGDHVGSNTHFPATVEIVTHENTAANMKRMPVFQDAANAHGLPDRTYADRHTLLSGADAIDLYYFGPAHTDGDTFVVFRGLRVMHAGDVFPGASVPFMDGSNGGTGVGYPETMAKAIAGIAGVETVIPGHSGVTTWQAFVDYGEFTRAFVDAARAAMKAGHPAAEAAKQLALPDKFKDYGMQRAPANLELIYKELQR